MPQRGGGCNQRALKATEELQKNHRRTTEEPRKNHGRTRIVLRQAARGFRPPAFGVWRPSSRAVGAGGEERIRTDKPISIECGLPVRILSSSLAGLLAGVSMVASGSLSFSPCFFGVSSVALRACSLGVLQGLPAGARNAKVGEVLGQLLSGLPDEKTDFARG